MRLIKLSIIAVYFCGAYAVHAETVDPKCLRSIQVKNKPVFLANQAVSCQSLENYKLAIFKRYDNFVSSATSKELEGEVERLQRQLNDANAAKNWTSFMAGANIVGNMIATVGLTACLETVGAGCAAAAVGAIIAKLGIIDSAASISEKQSAAASIGEQLTSAKQALSKHQSIKPSQDKLAKEFNDICRIIETQCQ